MKTKQIQIVLLGAVLASPWLLTSCSGNHPVAAGAAGAAVYNERQEEQRKDDIKDAADNREKRR